VKPPKKATQPKRIQQKWMHQQSPPADALAETSGTGEPRADVAVIAQDEMRA
jgi:hypothetical protein